MQVPVDGDIQDVKTLPGAHYFDEARKRFQNERRMHAASLVLGADGKIVHLTPAARRMLEYRPQQTVDPSFFTHVHGQNLYQVMRDVADMVCYGKNSANWLLRMRTGQGRWRWFKASVTNAVDGNEGTIRIDLNDLGPTLSV